MAKAIDRVGQVTNGRKAIALSPLRYGDSAGKRWEMACLTCGAISHVNWHHAEVKGCRTCFNRSKRRDPQRMALKRVRKGYIGKAKIRGYPWRLSDAQFEELTRMPCAYCKTERGGQYTHRMKSGDESTHHFMGVDRVDNSLGYEEDNVVPCCKTCNYAKQQMSVDAFLSWAHRVADANPR